jgi:hypothetical protein
MTRMTQTLPAETGNTDITRFNALRQTTVTATTPYLRISGSASLIVCPMSTDVLRFKVAASSNTTYLFT